MKRTLAIILMASVAASTAVPAAAQLRSDGSKFLEAVKERDGTVVEELLGAPGNTLVNARDLGSGRNALHITVERRDTLWLKFLLERGANPNLADKRGITPLQLAARGGFVEGVEALLTAGAATEVGDETGESPLIAAVHRRDLAMVRVLLANSASPDRTDNSGRSARDYAKLMAGSSALLDAMATADSSRKAAAQSYGPN